MEVHVFGVRGNADTRAALRFFAERRVKVHFVDFELGLAVARYSTEQWLERLIREPLLLRIPLVRWQQHLTVGRDETTWRGWQDGSVVVGASKGERR